MRSKDFEKSMRELSMSIGDFIHYWGFRRIHGALWAQLFVSSTPLSVTELARRLDVSKALVSPALTELAKYGLIREVPAPDDRSVLFEAVGEAGEVVRKILKSREVPMLEKINQRFQKVDAHKAKPNDTRDDRLLELKLMIGSASAFLSLFVEQDEILELPLKAQG